MGTRNLTMVVVDGEYKVAQYGQWDGYPRGQGATVLKFLRSLKKEGAKESFIKRCKAIKHINEEELEKKWVACGAKIGNSYVSMDVSDRFKKEYPQFSRDTGAGVLSLIAKSPYWCELESQLEFVGSSLFCVWAYVVDFDKETFEIYEGFNKTKLDESERFAKINDGLPSDGGYYAVKHLKTYPLSKLPSEKKMISDCGQNEK